MGDWLDAEERFFKAIAKGPEHIERAHFIQGEHVFADPAGAFVPAAAGSVVP